jgi:hypothetical protein
MNFKWFGPLALLAAIVIGDQVRINRPGHKYRLAVTVETLEGSKSGSGVFAVHPDRGYSQGGHTRTKGDAIFVDLGAGKNLVVLLAQLDPSLDLDGTNYLALRAYNAARSPRVPFSAMSGLTGTVPVEGALVPVLVSFADVNDPASARRVMPDHPEAVLGPGFHLGPISVEVVPNGFWPLDFGGRLGEPVTRGIVARLPWLRGSDDAASTALKAAGLQAGEPIDAKQAFTRN